MRSIVDLPQPEGPTKETNSPARISKLASASAVVPLGNDLVTLLPATSTGGSVYRSIILVYKQRAVSSPFQTTAGLVTPRSGSLALRASHQQVDEQVGVTGDI